MNTIGQRIAEKLAADNLLFRTMGMESQRLAKETEQQVAALINTEVAPLVEALRELRGAISDFKGHGMPGFTDRVEAYLILQKVDLLLALAGQEPEEDKKRLGNETLPAQSPVHSQRHQTPNKK